MKEGMSTEEFESMIEVMHQLVKLKKQVEKIACDQKCDDSDEDEKDPCKVEEHKKNAKILKDMHSDFIVWAVGFDFEGKLLAADVLKKIKELHPHIPQPIFSGSLSPESMMYSFILQLAPYWHMDKQKKKGKCCHEAD